MRVQSKLLLKQPIAWLALAATLAFGAAIGFLASGNRDTIIASHPKGMIASGSLDRSLTHDAAANSAAAAIHIGVTFLAKSGEYCRSFALIDGKFAGYACREETNWRIRRLEPTLATEAGDLRTAASVMPPSVLVAMAQDMLGEALDAEQEAKALAAGWKN